MLPEIYFVQIHIFLPPHISFNIACDKMSVPVQTVPPVSWLAKMCPSPHRSPPCFVGSLLRLLDSTGHSRTVVKRNYQLAFCPLIPWKWKKFYLACYGSLFLGDCLLCGNHVRMCSCVCSEDWRKQSVFFFKSKYSAEDFGWVMVEDCSWFYSDHKRLLTTDQQLCPRSLSCPAAELYRWEDMSAFNRPRWWKSTKYLWSFLDCWSDKTTKFDITLWYANVWLQIRDQIDCSVTLICWECAYFLVRN